MEGISIREARPREDVEGVRALLAPEMSLYRRRFGDFVIERMIREAAVFVVATRSDLGIAEGVGEGKKSEENSDEQDSPPLAVLSACFDPCSGGGIRSDDPIATKLFDTAKAKFTGCADATVREFAGLTSPHQAALRCRSATSRLYPVPIQHARLAQQSSTMWLLLFAVSPDLSEKQQSDVAQALFRKAFSISTRSERMWLLTPPGEPSPEKSLTA